MFLNDRLAMPCFGLAKVVGPVIGIADPEKRIIAVLVCYLDDSHATDGPFMTMAGYVGALTAWQEFEIEATPYIRGNGITCLHAKDFYSNDGEFKGWTINRKLNFLTELYAIFRPHVGMAISFSTKKDTHKFMKRETGLSVNQSPYGFCFVGLLNLLIKDDGISKAISTLGAGLSFVIEEGNTNNSGVLKSYRSLKKNTLIWDI